MSDKPALTPKQMLEKTVAIYENLVGKSTRLKSKKQEVSLIFLGIKFASINYVLLRKYKTIICTEIDLFKFSVKSRMLLP